MLPDKVQEVIVYHDETREAGKGKLNGHVLLFIPRSLTRKKSTPLFGDEVMEYRPLAEVHQKITNIRSDHRITTKLHFNEISGRKWGMFDLGTRLIVQAGVDALKHKNPSTYSQSPCCKLAVMFYPKSPSLSRYGGSERKEKQLRYDETVMRILLKGALHYLYGPSYRVMVRGIISDGQPYHRELDLNRAAKRVLFDGLEGTSSLRDYAEFSSGFAIKQIPSDHRLHELSSPDYIHANLLQLADVLLGAVIRCCYADIEVCKTTPALGSSRHEKKDVIAYPVREMLEKARRGPGFRHSSHYQAFSVSQIAFKDQLIDFTSVMPQERLVDDGSFSLFTD